MLSYVFLSFEWEFLPVKHNYFLVIHNYMKFLFPMENLSNWLLEAMIGGRVLPIGVYSRHFFCFITHFFILIIRDIYMYIYILTVCRESVLTSTNLAKFRQLLKKICIFSSISFNIRFYLTNINNLHAYSFLFSLQSYSF